MNMVDGMMIGAALLLSVGAGYAMQAWCMWWRG